MRDLVPNNLIAAAFLASGKTASAVALELGWVHNGKGDTSRLKRALGLAPWSHARSGSTTRYTNKQIDYGVAVLICRAIGATPRELDL